MHISKKSTNFAINFKIFASTGGMPSSHSAGVIGLSTTVGLICGFSSIEFAMAIGYALVVMYDAAGVRRAAGKQARVLNQIIANYKETQTTNIKEGQTVDIEVDAIPGIVFKGVVGSLSKATGASYSLLPQDNSAGNFVKIEQTK